MTSADIPQKVNLCVADTVYRYGYDPYQLTPTSREPVVCACVVCGALFEIQLNSIFIATGKCKDCRFDIDRRKHKKGGWHIGQARDVEIKERSEHRRCWICNKYLDYNESWYCSEHQEIRDRAFRRRREYVIAA
jgi:predicted nucleic acid-binding Zn ribbon protein